MFPPKCRRRAPPPPPPPTDAEIDAEEAAAEPKTHRDEQRGALEDLLELATGCAGREAAIERQFQAASSENAGCRPSKALRRRAQIQKSSGSGRREISGKERQRTFKPAAARNTNAEMAASSITRILVACTPDLSNGDVPAQPDFEPHPPSPSGSRRPSPFRAKADGLMRKTTRKQGW